MFDKLRKGQLGKSSKSQKHLLFVDDEQSVRITLPPILKKHGFNVQVASTVAEALDKIDSSPFDVLVSDLNIHRQGDGFLVISAMRHVQPDCINFILTAYPGLDNALQAIQHQVDDYFIKPADTEVLVSRLNEKLTRQSVRAPARLKRLAAVLKENKGRVMQNILLAMKRDPKSASIHLSDAERIDHLPAILSALIEQLDTQGDTIGADLTQLVWAHARVRRDQGYTIAMFIKDFLLIEETLFDLLQSEAMPLGTVGLAADFRRLTRNLHGVMLKSLEVYT